jgi:hypothetical protein
MSDRPFIIEYMNDLLTKDKPALNTDRTPRPEEDPALLPVERLEARICELAGHLTAATCRFLELVADFDNREGWAPWQMPSCAAWLSWKCQIAPGTAREHVRVARALPGLPLIRAEFAAARLSYAKARALTRIATADNEEDLAQMAIAMTAGQLERFARAHRRVTDADGARARSRRQLRWGWADDHEFSFRGQLPPEQAAVVLQALRAAVGARPPRPAGRDGRGPAAAAAAAQGGHREPGRRPRRDLRRLPRRARRPGRQPRRLPGHHPRRDGRHHRPAGARRRSRGNAEGARRPGRDRAAVGVPGKPPRLAGPLSHRGRRRDQPGHPADDSPATPPSPPCPTTPRAASSTPAAAPASHRRRYGAVRERDRHRCRYPGCESRRVDAHHIRYWSNGGQTNLANLISLCKAHHHLVHDKGIIIAATSGGFTFHLPDGARLANSPPLPPSSPDAITQCHGAQITPTTIVSPHSGGRLDLNMAVWAALTNAEIRAKRRERAEQAA